ncbi:class I SAM-dependent methyltransferase [Cyanobium sp. ATX 6F1]|uniref:class I SAM-dependent methyltransferase n=1 Tax=unclassified Cyanobium TaxID=2627006 RepID=UPI0020CB9C0D|nr:methyltransferase domain-containing protein [Cyanobium sp. ATX 6F1]MCP9915844.1 methyltransferase domain-containing protein [Cyanobium sp. ATX 6F1]
MKLPDSIIAESKRILDVGGWFKPASIASHVIDLMPWETRGARLCAEQQADENFSKETWFQANFLDPNFRMPFEDDFFDLVLCGHTIEDLINPRPVLNEMTRVGKAGVIECPSRLAEQTIGISDRMSKIVGYQHHHWIVDVTAEQLYLYSKDSSKLESSSQIPFRVSERMFRNGHKQSSQYYWKGSINSCMYDQVDLCSSVAQEYAAQVEFELWDRTTDSLVRLLRRAKYNGKVDSDWWEKIVEISRPYSSIEI